MLCDIDKTLQKVYHFLKKSITRYLIFSIFICSQIKQFSSMNVKLHELGSQPVFLGSCAKQCSVPFSSFEKRFKIFNSDIVYSVKIDNGLGQFDILGKVDENKDEDEEDKMFFDDTFEVENGKISENSYPQFHDDAMKIYDHIWNQVANLYNTMVTKLHFGLGVKMNEEPHLYLIDVYSCEMEEHFYCDIIESVPNGMDLISQMVILYSKYCFKSHKCLCFKKCDNRCPKAALGSTLKYEISKIFYDCPVAELYVFIKKLIITVNPNFSGLPISLCPHCYYAYQRYESDQIKSAQILQQYSQSLVEERRLQELHKKEQKILRKKSRLSKRQTQNQILTMTSPLLYQTGVITRPQRRNTKSTKGRSTPNSIISTSFEKNKISSKRNNTQISPLLKLQTFYP